MYKVNIRTCVYNQKAAAYHHSLVHVASDSCDSLTLAEVL